jgi:hypothetical protein
MKINRNNYELFFIDYLDGNLSDRDILMLEDFLLINPDLRTELEGTENIILTPDKFDFKQKDLLKKPDLSLPVNEDNFEDFCIAETENDLNDQQRFGLAEFLKQNPGYKNIFMLFSRLHLMPDQNVIFPEKEKLKKKLVLIPGEILYPLLSVAAVLAIVLILNFRNEEKNIKSLKAELPSEIISKPGLDTSGVAKKAIDVQPNIPVFQQASVVVHSSPKGKKQTKAIRELKPLEKKPDENKNKDVLTLQKINPSFRIKLPSVAYNQVSVPKIQRGKVIYGKENSSQNKQEYLSVAEYARKHFKEKVLGSKEGEDDRLSAWQLADAGINGINKITKGDIKLQKRTDDKGNITAYSFNSKYLSFSTTR